MARKQRRGFAAMDPEQHREIARLGGLAVHAKGTAHIFTREEARHARKMGGWVTSRDCKHMARIGRKGSAAVEQKRAEEEKRKGRHTSVGSARTRMRRLPGA